MMKSKQEYLTRGNWGLLFVYFVYFSGINRRKWVCWSKH